MPTPRLKDDHLREVVAMVEEAYRAGLSPGDGRGTENAAIQRVTDVLIRTGSISGRQGVYDRLRFAKERLQLEPDASLYIPPRYQQPVARLNLVPAASPRPLERPGTGKRILVIPDRHRCPLHPHRIAYDTIIARFGSDIRADEVVDLGDAMSFDSVSRHERNDTVRGRYKPPIKADLDHHDEMLAAFERGRAPDWKPKKRRTRGNHEHRLFDFENQHPEDEGSHTHRYMQSLLQFGWTERPFGEILYIEGVGFTHAPFSGMGKPMAGKTSTHRAGNLLTQSLVHGHTHAFEVHQPAKLGLTDKITIVQAGCALPPGEVEAYARHSPTGWSYGVLDLWVQDGAIVDLAFKSLERLRSIYSDDGSDVRAA